MFLSHQDLIEPPRRGRTMLQTASLPASRWEANLGSVRTFDILLPYFMGRSYCPSL